MAPPPGARRALTGATALGLSLACGGTAVAAVATSRERAAPRPKVIVTARPPRVTHTRTAVLRFVSSRGRGWFQCRLDGGRWRACHSPRRYVSLTEGRHRVAIRVRGRRDRWHGTAVRVSWTVKGSSGSRAPRRRSISVQYLDAGAHGVADYKVVSPQNGPGPQLLRVLEPTHPAHGVPHNFLYVLPVELGTESTYGDGIKTLRGLDAQNRYDLTIVEPSFAVEPWYANNPTNPALQYETFLTKDLVPWVTHHLATTGREQNWLLGFSKSGLGAQDLILRNPSVFTAAASWDFPADMDSSTKDGELGVGNGVNYGSNANFRSHYRLTPAFVAAHKGPFLRRNRIWIGSYQVFRADVANYDALLTATGIKHTTEPPQRMRHRWGSGWVPIALKALARDGAALPRGP
jgi:S-formylglutathione hydrolase FrmB